MVLPLNRLRSQTGLRFPQPWILRDDQEFNTTSARFATISTDGSGAVLQCVMLPFRREPASNQEKIAPDLRPNVSTPIKIRALRSELLNHPDRKFVEHLINSLSCGFDTGFQSLPSNSIICENLKSATDDPVSVSELVKMEVKNGYLLGPFDSIPYPNYRINSIGLAEHKYSKKKRLIVDLSAPHQDVNNPSLNSF